MDFTKELKFTPFILLTRKLIVSPSTPQQREAERNEGEGPPPAVEHPLVRSNLHLEMLGACVARHVESNYIDPQLVLDLAVLVDKAIARVLASVEQVLGPWEVANSKFVGHGVMIDLLWVLEPPFVLVFGDRKKLYVRFVP